MRRWGISRKILFLALAPMALLTLTVGCLLTRAWLDQIDTRLDAHGQSLSRQLAAAAGHRLGPGERNRLPALVGAVLEEQDVRAVSLFDARGEPILRSGPRLLTDPPALQRRTTGTTVTGERSSLFISPALPSGQYTAGGLAGVQARARDQAVPTGWALVELSHSNRDKERYKTLLISLLLVFAGLLVNTFIALGMTRTFNRPVAQLSQAVNRLKNGRFDQQVEVDAGPELQELEAGLNEMATALSRAQAEMQQNVDQATEDLRETLETIEIQNIELDLARKEALEASRIKSEFLANMSHEIRTPLNGIIGFTDILLKDSLAPQQHEHLTTIRKSSEILLTIINDILDFSKIEAGKLVLDRVPYRLREIVEEVMVMLAPAAHAKDLDLVPLVYNDVPDNLLGDPLRIKQVISNLINNAIKFTPSGEVVLRAMLAEGDDDAIRIRFSVSDTGVGLSRSQQQALFHAFSQADPSTARQYGGTGLGLVISRRLVEEMGGDIGLESELGKGSTFWFTLVAEPAVSAEPQPPQEGLRGERIIYLEHQPTTGLAAEHLLREWGVHFDRASSPRELADRVAAAQEAGEGYAAVLLGLDRHLLGSAQYRNLVQQLEISRDCRVLLMTPTLDHQETGYAARASAHLIKPLCRNRFYQTLFRLVHGETGELAEPEHSAVPPAPMQAEGQTGPRILAVDDNEANLKLVLALLKEMGLPADGAASGYEALALIRHQAYDLILMDVQMPGMDGVETVQRIRAMGGEKQHAPIVALTAHALSEERQRLLNSGFNAYLTKPIDTRQLAACLDQHTGFRASRTMPGHGDAPDLKPALRPSSRHHQARAVDIEAGIRLAGGKPDLAEELFSMLLEELDRDTSLIPELWSKGEHRQLLERVHKLHGATRYCGVPELRQCAQALEVALKRNEAGIRSRISRLLEAIRRVQHWCDQTDWQQLFRESAAEFSL